MSIEIRIRQKIEAIFCPVFFELENESHQHAGPAHRETHFRMILVSEIFVGMNRVDRQRRVMALLSEERAEGLHALTFRAFAPEEWEQVKDQFVMASPPCAGGSRRELK